MPKANLILHTYTRQSPTVDALKTLLNCRRIYRDTSTVAEIPHPSLIVNFGASKLNEKLIKQLNRGCVILNKPDAVKACISKLSSAAAFAKTKIPTPAVTRNRIEAAEWLRRDGVVLVREDGNYAGQGITVAENLDQFNHADGDFYSRYLDKTHEFRFHVFNGQIIDVIEKRHKAGRDSQRREKVYSHANGFLFYRDQVNLTNAQKEQIGACAMAAVQALGLDFGGVDVLAKIIDGNLQGYAVCEVNSSPALDGDAAKSSYVNAILGAWREVVGAGGMAEAPVVRRAGNEWGV